MPEDPRREPETGHGQTPFDDDPFSGDEFVLFTRRDKTPCAARLSAIEAIQQNTGADEFGRPPVTTIGLRSGATMEVYADPRELALRLAQGDIVDLEAVRELREADENERIASEPVTSIDQIEQMAEKGIVTVRGQEIAGRQSIEVLYGGKKLDISDDVRRELMARMQGQLSAELDG